MHFGGYYRHSRPRLLKLYSSLLRMLFILVIGSGTVSCAAGVQSRIDRIKVALDKEYQSLVGKSLSDVQDLTGQLNDVSLGHGKDSYFVRPWKYFKTPEVLVPSPQFPPGTWPVLPVVVYKESGSRDFALRIHENELQENETCRLKIVFDDGGIVKQVEVDGFSMSGSVVELVDFSQCEYLLPRIFVSHHAEYFQRITNILNPDLEDIRTVQPGVYPIATSEDAARGVLGIQENDDLERPRHFRRYCVAGSRGRMVCPPFQKDGRYRGKF